MNRARDDEMTFVLLGRDAAAPGAIRFWARERVRLGKNSWQDLQIAEAMRAAARMERNQHGGARANKFVDDAAKTLFDALDHIAGISGCRCELWESEEEAVREVIADHMKKFLLAHGPDVQQLEKPPAAIPAEKTTR